MRVSSMTGRMARARLKTSLCTTSTTCTTGSMSGSLTPQALAMLEGWKLTIKLLISSKLYSKRFHRLTTFFWRSRPLRPGKWLEQGMSSTGFSSCLDSMPRATLFSCALLLTGLSQGACRHSRLTFPMKNTSSSTTVLFTLLQTLETRRQSFSGKWPWTA